jgi:hypothetical protein
LIRHPPIIAPIAAQWQAILTERLRRNEHSAKFEPTPPRARPATPEGPEPMVLLSMTAG